MVEEAEGKGYKGSILSCLVVKLCMRIRILNYIFLKD
jgi:hypothetical protein